MEEARLPVKYENMPRKSTIFDCSCGREHVLVFEDVPDPYQTYRYRCPVVKKRFEVNGFLVSEKCNSRGRSMLLAKKI